MELGTLLLLGIIATLIILIVLQVRYSKREREEREWRERSASPAAATGAYPSKPPVVRISSGTRAVQAPRKPVAQAAVVRQVTLYQFPLNGGKWICPGCDGENDPSYCFCWICGQKIR